MRLIALAAIVFLNWQYSSSFAATIQTAQQPGCALLLEGEIQKGDFERLANAASREKLLDSIQSGEPTNDANRALCLNSGGGDYIEGRRMAGLIHKFGITTRVTENSSCFSACAFMFMAGHSLGGEVDGASRYMHVKAHVGFHAPYIQFDPSDQISGSEAMLAMEAVNKAIGEFIKFASYMSDFDTRPMFSMSLLSETLLSGPNELTEIASVEAAARWGVSLEGINPKAPIDYQSTVHACLNFKAWMLDKSAMQENIEYYLSKTPEIVSLTWGDGSVNFSRIDTGGMETSYCLVEFPSSSVSNIYICSVDQFNGLNFGDCESGDGSPYAHVIPWYYSLPASTALSSLALR